MTEHWLALSLKSNLTGILILSVIFISCILPLTLSFLPQTMGLIGAAVLYKRMGRKIFAPLSKAHLVLLLIPILTMASSIWSITPESSLIRSLKISGEILSFFPLYIFLYALPDDTTSFIKKYLPVPLILGGTFLAIELVLDFPISRILRPSHTEFSTWELNKSVAVFILMTPLALITTLIPFKKANWKHYRLPLLLLIPAAFILSATASQSAQLSVIAMIVALIGMIKLPRLALPLCFGTVILLFSIFPWVTTPLYKSFAKESDQVQILKDASTSTRLEVWDFVADKIHENPWTGFGIDTTRIIQFDYPMVYYWDTSIMHPHNAPLQLWIEFGALGALLADTLLLTLFLSIRRRPLAAQILPTVVFSGILIFLILSWSLWSSWLIGLMIFLTCIMSSLNKPPEPSAH
ncbi:MAG: hypothetical protein AUJ12_07935 [Alphaproteobacteria bacterium CG1_02_46_17]|nr:MAG: hypothetical protein AUJ12_07935 [Alphaproteobacteria bacterium CG1_02_46_17]